MDPDGIVWLVILSLFLVFLFIANLKGLIKKIWGLKQMSFKWALLIIILLLVVWAIVVYTVPVTGTWQVVFPFLACGFIGLNWSLNFSQRRFRQTSLTFRTIFTISATFLFVALLPFALYSALTFLEQLNLFGEP